ncbi:MAG: hypothetical protein OXC62_02160 [Aestuariivita sp.]|nr:hypothetical protein [Aestuariivita sp.]
MRLIAQVTFPHRKTAKQYPGVQDGWIENSDIGSSVATPSPISDRLVMHVGQILNGFCKLLPHISRAMWGSCFTRYWRHSIPALPCSGLLQSFELSAIKLPLESWFSKQGY